MALKDLFFNIFAKDKTGDAFRGLNRKLRETEGHAAALSDRLGRVGRSMSAAGAAGTVAVAPIALGLREVISATSEWEAALNRSNALLKPSNEEMATARDLTRELGRTTIFSAGEAAAGIEMLAKNGLKASDILGGALASSLDVAAAGGADLSSAADVVTDVMANFGVASAETAKVANGMAGVMSAAKFGFDDYAGALAQAGGVAGGLGVDLGDFNAAIAGTASLFASGADAGTSFKTFLTTLEPKSTAAAAAMAAIGFSAYDATGNMKSMGEISENLRTSLSGLSDQQKTAALSTIFGADAMRTAIGLAGIGANRFQELKDVIGNTSAEELAQVRMEGATGAILRYQSAMDGLAVAIGASGVLDMFTEIVNGLAGLVNWLGAMDPALLKFGAVLGGVGVVAAPLVAALGLVAAGIAAIGVPVAAAVAGIAAIGAAALAFGGDIAEIWAGLKERFDAMPQWVRGMADGIATALSYAIAPFKALIEAVETAEGAFAWLYDRVVGNSWVPDLVEEVGQHFALLKGNMVDPTDAATTKANDAFRGLAADVSGSLSQLARDGDLTWKGFLGSMEDAAQRQVDSIINTAFDRLTQAGTDALSGAFSSLLGGAGSGGGASAAAAAGGGLFGWAKGLLGFDTGGAFTVRGRAGIDRNVATVRLSEGEHVEVTRRGDTRRAVNLTMNITTPDVESFRRSRSQIAAEMRRGLSLAERAS